MNKKVLLADDSITIQKVVDIIFATESYDLSMTDDGDKALEKAIQEHPDVVIADISMPGRNGFELCREIKNNPALKNTAVLLLPGAFDHFDEQKAHEVCADGWLTKPFESQALLDKMAQLLAAEPLRLSTDEVAEEGVEDQETPVAAAADSAQDESVTDSTLGLDQVDALAAEDAEESAEDIWDAVSFAEEDLQPEAEDEEDEAFFSAAAATVATESDLQETEEPGGAQDSVVDPEPDPERETESVAALEETNQDEDSDINAFSADQAGEGTEPKGQDTENLNTTVASSADAAALAGDSDEDVDFSRYSENDFAETVPTGTESDETLFTSEATDAETYSAESAEEEAPFVDSENFTAAAVEDEDIEAAISSEDTEFGDAASEDDVLGEPLAEEESLPTDIYAASVAAADALVSDTEEENNGEAIEEEILELNEDDIFIDEAETLAVTDNFDQGLKETAAEDETEVGEDGPDVGFEYAAAVEPEAETNEDDDFIFADEENLADATTTVVGPVSEELEDDSVVADTGDADLSDGEPAPAAAEGTEGEGEDFVFAAEEPLADAVTAVADSNDEGAIADEADAAADEDESFSFDVPAEGSSAPLDEDSATTVPAQPENLVEQQLRELSEEELKELVAKVAGPLIEKMAGEMLEQIAWEVVPDLAEAMIKEEIRKLKEAVK
jgi:CheY-like chemotaxis protein